MNKEIKFTGLANIPDDYQSPDGQLDTSLNLINEDGHLRPLFQPQKMMAIPDGYRVVYIHSTAVYKHYILLKNNRIAWCDESATVNTFNVSPDTQTTIHDIIASGNTLMVLTSFGIYYYLWREVNNVLSYNFLGNSLPEPALSFGLQCRIKKTDKFKVDFHGVISQQNYTWRPVIRESDKTAFTNAVLGQVNKLITEEVQGDNRFCMPFFVRYALRLYNGTYTHQSAPVLMLPNNGANNPVVFCLTRYEDPGSGVHSFDDPQSATLRAYLPACKLDYTARVANLGDWKDVIQSIDIFVSAPFWSYDQDGKVEEFVTGELNSFGIYSMDNLEDKYSDPLLTRLKKYSYWKTFNAITTEEWDFYYSLVKLPTRGEAAIKKDIENCANFYLIKSIPIDELSSSRTILELEEGTLSSLLTRPTLPDDYDSHDVLLPSKAYVFNNRINLFNIRKKLFGGYFNMPYVETYLHSFQFSNVEGHDYEMLCSEASDCFSINRIFVYIKNDNGTVIVEDETFYPNPLMVSCRVNMTSIFFVPWFYHPNPNAFKVVFVGSVNNVWKYLTLDLRKHDFLNGSYYFDNFNPQSLTESPTLDIQTSGNNIISLPNKLYTSEVNNPFFFPVTGINTIGTGTINGIATVTEPLSQGQFGYADIYVFCSDGIWVAQINQQGAISNINPVNKDVCTNPDSITQLGSSILYATQRGIMQIYGRNVECISDIIATEHPFNHLSALPKLSTINSNLPSIAPFSDFLSGCRMLYDYIHQRIIVFNPSVIREVAGWRVEQGVYDPVTDTYGLSRLIYSYKYSRQYNYAYVFSLRSKLWGMMQTDLLSSLNSYPEALAMAGTLSNAGIESDTPAFSSLNLVSFDNPVTTNPVDGIAISRPLKLDLPDTLKSVYELIQRGVFDRGNVKTILYGSRDLASWHLIASSVDNYLRGLRGTPYKYFRLVAITSLDDNQALDSATVIVEPRHINQLH